MSFVEPFSYPFSKQVRVAFLATAGLLLRMIKRVNRHLRAAGQIIVLRRQATSPVCSWLYRVFSARFCVSTSFATDMNFLPLFSLTVELHRATMRAHSVQSWAFTLMGHAIAPVPRETSALPDSIHIRVVAGEGYASDPPGSRFVYVQKANRARSASTSQHNAPSFLGTSAVNGWQ